MAAKRPDGRRADELRPVSFIRRYTRHAPGSVLVSMGETRVLCTATFEPEVPAWLKGGGQGWLTAEYGMLPSSTPERKRRPDGKPDSRSQEIRRLIGRALRAVCDLAALGELTVYIDCDVLQADGGTRTASINGAYVALADAVAAGRARGLFARNPLVGGVVAVSAGLVDGRVLLDLNYDEDRRAEADFNIVMTHAGQYVEVQGAAERAPFGGRELAQVLAVAKRGMVLLRKRQKESLAT